MPKAKPTGSKLLQFKTLSPICQSTDDRAEEGNESEKIRVELQERWTCKLAPKMRHSIRHAYTTSYTQTLAEYKQEASRSSQFVRRQLKRREWIIFDWCAIGSRTYFERQHIMILDALVVLTRSQRSRSTHFKWWPPGSIYFTISSCWPLATGINSKHLTAQILQIAFYHILAFNATFEPSSVKYHLTLESQLVCLLFYVFTLVDFHAVVDVYFIWHHHSP